MSDALTTDVIDRLVAEAAGRPNPIQPARVDDGRRMYFVHTTRDQMFANLPPGWTLKAVAINGRFVGCEPVPIFKEELTGYVYYQDGYL